MQAVRDLHKGCNAIHESPTTFNQLLESLSHVVEEQVVSQARKSPFISLGVDESTDRAQEKHIVLVIRYIKQSSAQLTTTFLKCTKVREGKAQTLYNAMVSVLQKKLLPLTKVLHVHGNNYL